MPLVVITTSYPRTAGDSAGRPVAASVRALRDAGLGVEVIAPDDRGPLRTRDATSPGATVAADVVLRYAPLRRWQTLCYGAGIVPNLRLHPARALLVPALFAALAVAARQRRRRPIIAHWLLPGGLAAVLAGGDHVVAVAHGSDVALLERMPGGRALARLLATRCRAIACVSRDLARRFDALVDADTRDLPQRRLSRAAVLPPICDHAESIDRTVARRQLGIAPARPLVLYVGRLLATKGVDILMAAVTTLRQRPLLWIAGDGPLRQQLEQQARASDAAVSFLGTVAPAQRDLLLTAADVVAVPSRPDAHGHAEGLPAVVLEAMAAGRPLVASAVGGIPEVISDDVTGWLVPPGDVAALSRALQRALVEREHSAAIGRAARRMAASWTPACHVAALRALFRDGSRSA